MNFFILLFIGISIFSSFVQADIISENEICEINECYQFKDNELVKGKVIFKSGFVLPHNGVVIFDMDDDSLIDGVVVMNNAHLVVKNKLILDEVMFKGNGRIVNPVLNILGRCELSKGILSFVGDTARVESETSGFFVIKHDDACLDVHEVANLVAFVRVIIVGNGIKTALYGPQVLKLSNVNWVLNNNMVVNLDCQRVYMHGSNFITAVEGKAECVISHELNFAPSSELTINPKTSLSLGYITSADDMLHLILYNAQLRFLDRSGLPRLCNHIQGGSIIISGMVAIDIEGNRFFMCHDHLTISLERESRLILNDMDKVKSSTCFVPLRHCYAESKRV